MENIIDCVPVCYFCLYTGYDLDKMILGDIVNKFFENGSQEVQTVINESWKPSNGISSVFKKLSRYGMSYDEDVYRNMKALPADKILMKEYGGDNLYMPYSIQNQTSWKVSPEEEKPFAEKTLSQRRDMLRKMSTANELEDILDIVANECIVYDSDEVYVCHPYIDNAVVQDFNESAIKEIQAAVETIFYKMYLLCNWKKDAWNKFRRWLIDGDIAFEIIYDDLEHPHTIIGIVDLDPATLTKVVKNGVTYWVQYKGVMGMERYLYDAQVIYVKYEDTGVIDRQSYIERLIRPFNIYRIIEQAQIIWTVTQASFKTVFTIPVNGMGRARGLQTLQSAMNRYKEDISFNGETGELRVNNKMNLPFNKEYWMPENESGSPSIETLTDQGPDLNSSEQLKYFLARLYKASKVPESRFDKEMAATWFGTDPTQALRDEINFGRFTERLRSMFAIVLIKPMQIQLALQMPEIKNDKRVLDSIGLRWNSYNQFVELMEEQINMSRLEYIQSLKDTFTTTDAEGNESHYFCDKFLLVKYLKMSDADLELNAKLKAEEAAKAKKEGDDDKGDGSTGDDELDKELGLSGEDQEDTGNEEAGGEETGPESEEGNDIDKEMLGDVTSEK